MHGPPAITGKDFAARLRRIVRIARRLGFVGQIEYRHVFSQTGGAQFGLGRRPEDDLLIVHAEAFERDANPEDFTLEAMLAHERGHQVLFRHPRLARQALGIMSPVSEEIVASVIGALLCRRSSDRELLLAKATVELLSRGEQTARAVERIRQLARYLEAIL